MKRVIVEPLLGYFKRGSDLDHFLEKNGNEPVKSLIEHADMLRGDADTLTSIAKRLEGKNVGIDADTHVIRITCDEDVAKELIEAGIVYVDPWEDIDHWDVPDIELEDEID